MESLKETIARMQKRDAKRRKQASPEQKGGSVKPSSKNSENPTLPVIEGELVTEPATKTLIQSEMFAKAVLRPEYNFAKFADFIFISPYSRKAKEARTKHWTVEIEEGESMPASLTIEPLLDHKTPTTTSYKYFLALIQLWEEQGRPIDGKVLFSSRDVANILNLKWSGSVSKQLERELAILDSAKFTWKWSFLDNNKERKALVNRMNILSNSTYIASDLRRKKEKFTTLHTVTFHENIVQNLLAGVTKPINFHTILSIKSDVAAALYTHLDIVLSPKERTIWQRTARHLIYDDLHLTGERWNSKRTRKAKLEDLVRDLNGKPLSHGKLSLSIKETANGDDWKIVARKVSKKIKNRLPRSPQNTPELRQELLELINGVIGGLDTHKDLYGLFVASYSHTLIRQAVSEYKADIQNPRNAGAAFTVILHRIAHAHGKDWIKACDKHCKYRPENVLF